MVAREQALRVRRAARVLHVRALHAERRALESFRRPPVVVYSWSKTGSTTAYETLVRSRLWRPTYHVHSLDDGVETRQADHARAGISLGLSAEELRAVRILRHDLQHGDGPMALVTLVRDPVSRSISSFFQSHYSSAIDMTSEQPSPEAVSATVDELHERLPKLITSTDSWFVRQQQRTFGFDPIEEGGFDPAVGFARYRVGRFDQVIIRTDRFDETYRRAVEPLVGRRLGPVRRANTASEKRYAAHREATLAAFRLSPEEIELALDSRVVAHFFTTAERDAMARSWQAGHALPLAS